MSFLRRASVLAALVMVVGACGAPDHGSGNVLLDHPAPIAAPECPEGTVPVEVPEGTVPVEVPEGTVSVEVPEGTVPMDVPTTSEPTEPAALPTTTGSSSAATELDAGLVDVAPWPDGAPAPRSGDGRWSVVYLGDSMATLTVCLLQAELPDWTVLDVTYGGTAPCDWVDHPWLTDALAAEPDLVVFSFIGNSITACTEQAVGPALLDAYERDLVDICTMAAPARCVAVGQPVLDPGIARTLPGPDEPNGMFLAHAVAGDWGFIDAGHAAETADGSFEPGLREPDGVHFNDAGAAATAQRIAEYLRAAVTPPAP